MLTEEDVRRLFDARYRRAGTMKAIAEEAGVSQAYVSDVLAGKRGVGPALLKLLGLEKVTGYRRVKP